jgi:GNAT superfamily N-acetyltransferase
MTRIREATRGDNEGLLSLTALTPMGGEIAIRSDRYPDFFSLLDRRGPSHVLVAEKDGAIVASLSANRVAVYVDEKPESVYYVGDLKVHPGHRKSGLATVLLKAMQRDLHAAGADLILCTAAFGNKRVLSYMEGRAGLPRTVALGVFRVYQFLPLRRPRGGGVYEVREEPEHPEMLELYDDHFRDYQFGPIVGPGTLRDARHWVARSDGKIRASLSLLDVGDSRQNVIIRLPFALRSLVPIVRALRRIVPGPELPAEGTPVRTLYIKALACHPGHERALDPLIREARVLAFKENYHFVAIGLHERDPLGARLARVPKFTFRSLGFVTGLRRGRDELDALTRRIPYEDYSLV